MSYQSYDPEWEREVMKNNKQAIVDMLKRVAMERDTLQKENDVMYAALLEASELGGVAGLRCKVELQRIARNTRLTDEDES